MPSPFPGMDPYLEDYLWPDFHQNLAGAIQRQLTPKLRPRYVARLAVRMIQDPTPETEIGIMYPDVEILERQNPAGPGQQSHTIDYSQPPPPPAFDEATQAWLAALLRDYRTAPSTG